MRSSLNLPVLISDRKFGKHIQKRQLEVPEYAASFVNYKALKKVCAGSWPCTTTRTRLTPLTAHQEALGNTRHPLTK